MGAKDNRGNALRKPELLAPAGTVEAFMAALDAGADAVYVGLKELNARALASNFTLEEVGRLHAIAKERGARLLVAMNSLLKEDDIPGAVRYLAGLEALRVEALIIQDLGLWRLARKHFPGLRLHASTLMTIHNSLGVAQAHRMGFKRVVLAREMTLEEIRSAVKAAPIEVEVFIHGALCFTYSGLCLFSSYYGGRSSMRGRCVQPCRRLYSWAGKKGRFFSMGDLSALDLVWDLADAGVSSLKIEGRLRPVSYVSNVVRAYRILLDAPPGDKNALAEARGLLRKAMGRPYTKGYFMGRVPFDAIHPERTANTGTYAGRVLRVSKGNELVLRPAEPVSPGDRLRLVHQRRDAQVTVRVTSTRKRGGETILKVADWKWGFDPKEALVFKVDVSSVQGLKGKSRKIPSRAGAGVPQALKKAGARAEEVFGHLAGEVGEEPVPQSVRDLEPWVKFSGIRGNPLWRRPRPRKILLEVTEGNLRSLSRGDRRHAEIIWYLPPVIHENRLLFYEEVLAALMMQGFQRFQISDLGQVVLLERARSRARVPKDFHLDVSGDYTLNLLNSQSIRAAVEIGLGRLQFSMETDLDNLRKALSATKGIPVGLTVFAFPPLFTTRMMHRSYQDKRPVISQKGEKFFWMRRDGIGRLLPQRPFCILDQYQALKGIGLSWLVLDLSLWPKGLNLPRIPSWDIRTLRRLLRGRDFNMSSDLA